ncbi:MAG TPA: diadenylate cyclase CdaA [Candidatus Sulfomarinibacteraceae bacterium]|nr:diadenylate cyclase CdaA [Candidatus Sulfomarinibacteraceae bacterium]
MNDLWINLILRLQALTWTDWLDLLLVTIVLFILVNALQRAQAAFMLRGLALTALLLLIVALLLPLPTFGLLVRGILLFLLIAIPVVFQRELRHLLENVGRRIGFTPSAARGTQELMQPLVRTVEQMADQRIGALVVLQGEMDLDEIAETGVPIRGRVSSELLTAIFFPNNPLHDGAALIRGQTMVAAACVLPVSRRQIDPTRRLGTRHRAAVGLSERTDALVLVVSEETGAVSIAEGGDLQRIEDQTALQERIVQFAQRTASKTPPAFSVSNLFNPDTGRLRSSFARRLRHTAARLGLALLFAISLWWFVLSTASELPDVEVYDVPLQVENTAPGLVLASGLPETVDLVVRTVGDARAALDEEAFVARLDLDGLEEGVHRLRVEVTPRLNTPVQVVDIDPAMVEVDLAPVGQRTLPVSAMLDDEALPAVYEVQDEPEVAPETVKVSGPQPLVEHVVEVRATLLLSNTFGLVTQTRPLEPVDQDGNRVEGITLHPTEAEVRVTVGRQANVRELGVAILTTGEPAAGFWISGLEAEPSTIIVSGPEAVLAALGSAVPTLPLDVAGAAGDVTADMPLDLPPDLSVQTPDREDIRAVEVTVHITARRGNLTIERPVELSPADTAAGVSITPSMVELLLSGPQAALEEIRVDPDLVRVILELDEVPGGEAQEYVPEVVAPEGIGIQLVPPRVTVTGP